jgi:DNA-binding CsgD family transcriptional regulator
VNSNAFQRWNSDLANVIAHVSDAIFFQQVFAAIEAQVPVAYPQVWLYHKDLPPQLLDHKIPKEAYRSQVDEYLEGPYREDPFFKMSLSAPRNNCYRLSRLVTGDFEQSSYHLDYYASTGTVDEAIIVTRLTDGSVINISLMRLASQGEFSEEEYNWLCSVSQCLAELIDLHTRREEFVESKLLQPGVDHHIQQSYESFGSSYVSEREQEVLELLLRGYGADKSAEKLDISLETVRRHRKSIYKKLDVNSQADLFALFINVIPYVAQSKGDDPLKAYMG